jgi:hypothetical protein
VAFGGRELIRGVITLGGCNLVVFYYFNASERDVFVDTRIRKNDEHG